MLTYGIASTLTAMTSVQVGLRPRMLLVAFPLILAAGVVIRGRRYRVLLAASIVALVAFSLLTFSSLAATP